MSKHNGSYERNVAEVGEFSENGNQNDVFSKISPAYDILKAARPDRSKEPGYYGLPILKRPAWKWEIALYFFFEGVSGGVYVLCTVASLLDRKRHARAIRVGRYLSFFTMLPCPPLLIYDLGRPERFLHMLRIWKKTSPMNHGAWALSGFGVFASVLAGLAVPARAMPFEQAHQLLRSLQRWAPQRLMGVVGTPFALTMVSYPGVLLSTTANPVWAHTHFLGALFACSSMNAASAALTLCNYNNPDHGLHRTLSRFEDVATVAEAAALGLYLGTAKKATKPLLQGKQAKLFLFGAIGLGIVAPALLRRSKSKLLHGGLAPLLTLAGSCALKWSVTYAGQESALDPELANFNGETENNQPYWGPKSPKQAEVPATQGALQPM